MYIFYILHIYICAYIYKNLKPTPRGQWRDLEQSHTHKPATGQDKVSVPRVCSQSRHDVSNVVECVRLQNKGKSFSWGVLYLSSPRHISLFRGERTEKKSGVRTGREDGILLSVMLGAFLLTSPINPSKTVAADSCTLLPLEEQIGNPGGAVP